MSKPISHSVATFMFALVALSACEGGGSGSSGGGGDWYYHWNCHGDFDCLTTNPTGQPTGDLNEGPEYRMCSPLLQFSSRFWGPAAEDACDQSPTWSGSAPPAAPTLTSIVVTPANPSVNSGQSKQFTATAFYSNGSAAVVTSTSAWNSSASGIATVSGTGLATAITSGSSTIRATYKGVAGSTILNVNPNFSITSYSPQSGWPSVLLTLVGINFPPTAAGTVVKVCGLVATIESETSTRIEVRIPGVPSTQECTISVTTSNGTAIGSGTIVVFVGTRAPSVYWTERGVGGNAGQGSVMSMGKIAGSPAYTLASGLHGPWKVAGDATRLFWLEYQDGVKGAIKSMLSAGGVWSFVQTAVPVPSNIGLDSTHVYWTQFAGSSPGSLHKASLMTMVDDYVVGGTYGEPSAVAGDGTNIYFTVNGSSNLYRIPIAVFGTVSVVATGPASPGVTCYPTTIAVDASNAYWASICPASPTASAILQASLTTGVVTSIATGFGAGGTTNALVKADSTYVYWATGTGLYKVPIGGGSITVLASGSILSFAMDASDVFYTDGSALMKVSKAGGSVTTLKGGLVSSYGVHVDP